MQTLCTIFARMKQLIKAAALLFLAAPTALSAQSCDHYFAQSPAAVLPLLDRTAKLDLLDLYNGSLPAKAENVLGGQAELLRKTDSFLSLRLTEASTWEMKVLPSGSDTLIVCIHSVEAGGVISRIRAYHTDWREAKCEIPCPEFDAFYQIAPTLSTTRNQVLRTRLRPLPVEASWSDTTNVLTFRVSTAGLSRDDLADAQQCLHPLFYEWVAGKFQPISPTEAAEQQISSIHAFEKPCSPI